MLESPRKIIRGKQVVIDDWQLLRLDEFDKESEAQIPEGRVIVPLPVWRAQAEKLKGRGNLGIWLASDATVDSVLEALDQFEVIAVDFPKFSDGRGYSLAYQLRAYHGYRKELRAIGDVLRDQLFYMQRVGFDTFAVRLDRDIEDALKGLSDFTEPYQGSFSPNLPLFRRVKRETISEFVDIGGGI